MKLSHNYPVPAPMPAPEELFEQTLTFDEVCDALRCSKTAIYKLMACGELPSFKRLKYRVFLKRDVLAYLERYAKLLAHQAALPATQEGGAP